MEARGKTIEQWFSMVQQGQIVLPRFQRHEAWRHGQIVGLLENILRKPSLPIGALLILEVGDKEPFHSRPIVGAPLPTTKPSMHLLDGQQRMTALWRALTGHYDDLSLFVSLEPVSPPTDLEEGEIAPDAPSISGEKRWMNKDVRRPVWANDDVEVFKRNLLPIECLCPGQQGEKRLADFQKNVRAGGYEPAEKIGRIYEMRMRVASYMIPFLSLPVGTGRETALDVFIKMNTSATPLRDYDIVVAQLEEAMRESLHEKIQGLKTFAAGIDGYGNVEDIALSVAALLAGKPPLKKTYLEKDFGKELARVWPDVLRGMRAGVNFLRKEGIYGEKTLPTEVAVYLVCALWAKVPEHGFDAEGNARSLIRKTLWRACFTNRYLKTATTRAFADFKSIAPLIAGSEDKGLVELFDSKANPLPEAGALVGAGWPSRKDRLPRAILAVSLRAGGLDFADGDNADHANVEHREYHHIFPKATFPENTNEAFFNCALNCALITWRTNRKIAANTPKAYIEARADAANLGEEEVRDRLGSHLISYNDLIAGDYETFLQNRAEDIQDHIVALCDGWRPSAKARP